jgi:hypothetical protein
MVLANWRVTIDEVACSLQISHGSAYQIIHDKLSFHYAKCVLRKFTAEHKHKCVEICQCLLDRYNNEGKEFLSKTVTGDEAWPRIQKPETPGIANKEEIQDSIFHGKSDERLPGKRVYCSLFLLCAHC